MILPKTAFSVIVTLLAWTLTACGSSPSLPADDGAAFQILTGKDGPEFLRQISAHDWPDEGRGAAERLAWIARDADSSDHGKAERAGAAANVLATFLSANQDELFTLKAGWFGLQHRTIGELNPDLVTGYATVLIPFQGALVGDKKGTKGFEIIGDPLSPSAARNVFAVIDTSTQAGDQFNDAAYERVRSYLQIFGQAVADEKADGLGALQFAARLAGAVEGGQRESGNSAVQTLTSQHHINWAGYEVAKAMGVKPGEPDISDSFFTPEGRLKSPDEVPPRDLAKFSTALQNFAFNHGLPSLGSDFQNWYDDGAGK